MAHEGLHESEEKLSPATTDAHRAIISLMEEFEAADWYRQRAEACADPELRAVLIHNLNEELEHAAMLLEWLRRRIPELSEALRTYLFTAEEIVRIEETSAGGAPKPALRFTVGDMKNSNPAIHHE
ncbi:MAG: ferritin [Pseudomonadota bacterium]